MKQRILYLTKYYGVTVIIFIIAKLVFLCFNSDKEPLGASDVWEVILHGISLDLSTALYLLSIPFLLTLACLWIHIPRIVYRIYNITIAIVLPLAFIADTCLYPFWQFKLDSSCLTYLESPAEVLANISTLYIVAILIIWALAAFTVFFVYKKIALHMERNSSVYHLYSSYCDWHPWRFGRINHQYRTSLLLSASVPEPCCGKPCILILRIT